MTPANVPHVAFSAPLVPRFCVKCQIKRRLKRASDDA